MKVSAAIEKRRSYRSLEKIEIGENVIKELIHASSLAPSCFNNQPWRYVFVTSPKILEKMKTSLKKGNEWAHEASCIAAVISKKDLDCVIGGTEYYLFDTGIGVGQLILKATEMGIVAHIIAGFEHKKVEKFISLPEDWNIISLIIFGKRSKKKLEISDEDRPERLSLKYVYSIDEYSKKLNKKVKH
ncbi:MAG: nitroreductase family protein [Candidatus Delongbacteria bacterium]|jgi:nitroreductase|nr:nitroreductase family protein [Candidatus Delongbacteria bacterium]MDD4205645.1 nitroreductase family protein [Candidatus Delongbacteria bacterium]MDY0017303.1 nitroreductase family protein [Candidatus Delongbacteria bacterium]